MLVSLQTLWSILGLISCDLYRLNSTKTSLSGYRLVTSIYICTLSFHHGIASFQGPPGPSGEAGPPGPPGKRVSLRWPSSDDAL